MSATWKNRHVDVCSNDREKIKITGTQTNCRPACISNRETLTSVRDFIKGQIGNLKRSHFFAPFFGRACLKCLFFFVFFLNRLSILTPLLLQHLFSSSKKQQVPLLPVIHIEWMFSHEENRKKKSKCSCVKQFPCFPTLGSLNLVVKEINDGETTRVLYLSKSTNTTLKITPV